MLRAAGRQGVSFALSPPVLLILATCGEEIAFDTLVFCGPVALTGLIGLFDAFEDLEWAIMVERI
jgi:hypothetical protein